MVRFPAKTDLAKMQITVWLLNHIAYYHIICIIFKRTISTFYLLERPGPKVFINISKNAVFHSVQTELLTGTLLKTRTLICGNIIKKEIQSTAAHKRYIQIAWQREQPFDEVHLRLKEVVSFVATLLA